MPLGTTAFAMTTQPLMWALREEEAQGNIQGLNIGQGKSLLYQLFVYDTRICITAEEAQFDKLKDVIRDFEVASGASLNLQKSIVMQMRSGPSQMWMEESGWEVAGPRKNFVYLGVSTSTLIDEKVIADEIVQKLMKKLKHWSNSANEEQWWTRVDKVQGVFDALNVRLSKKTTGMDWAKQGVGWTNDHAPSQNYAPTSRSKHVTTGETREGARCTQESRDRDVRGSNRG
ncbi:hypothetical protein R1sor_001573 [Riccia sorocarpa]|uniref:Reverse transcriptase domain-containing protein n=1 Tax=Riccia sorocarpa TaxID=122646 RepID=A0ABD3GY95_9MARC